jgi:stage II sporulation protein B
MEKAKITIRPQKEGLKVVVKSKEEKHPNMDKPTGLSMDKLKNNVSKGAAGLRVNPVREKEEKVKSFMDAAAKYQFPKVFQAEEPPRPHVIEWGSPNNPFFLKNKPGRKPSSSDVVQLLLSIGGAVLVGTMMGISVLNLFFTDEPAHSSRSIDDHLPGSIKTEVRKEKESASSAVSAIPLPSLNVVMLQVGNFSEKEGAEKTDQAYRTRGLAALMSEQAPYRIFLGMGMNRDDALKLSAIYQKQDIHVYLKDLNIRGNTSALKGEQAAELPAIIQTGHQIFQRLGKISAKNIHADPAAVPASFEIDSDILDQHRKFVTECQAIEASLPRKAGESLAEMTRAIDQAVQSGQEAKRNPNQALLWQIQEGLVRYASSYEQLVQTLK